MAHPGVFVDYGVYYEYPISPNHLYSELIRLGDLAAIVNPADLKRLAHSYFDIMSRVELSYVFAFLITPTLAPSKVAISYASLLQADIDKCLVFLAEQSSKLQEPLKDAKTYLLKITNTFLKSISPLEHRAAVATDFHRQIRAFAEPHPALFVLKYYESGGKKHVAFFICYLLSRAFLTFNIDRNTFPELGIKEFFEHKLELSAQCARMMSRDAISDVKKAIATLWHAKKPFFNFGKGAFTELQLFTNSELYKLYLFFLGRISLEAHTLSAAAATLNSDGQQRLPLLPLTCCFDDYYQMPD